MSKLKLAVFATLPIVVGLVVFAFVIGDSSNDAALSSDSDLEEVVYNPDVKVAVDDKGPAYANCLIRNKKPHSPDCRFGVIGSQKKIALFGDSHALHWTPALFALAKKRGWEVTVLTRANCKPPLVEIDPACEEWRRNALARIENEKPGLVVVGTNTGGNTTVLKDGVKLDRDAGEPVLREGMVETLKTLRASGAEVTVMRDLPISKKYLPPECLGQNPTEPEFCSFPKERPAEHAYELEAANQVDGVQTIDPLPKVCPDDRCQIVDGNILKFRDRGHMSATYNRTLADWLDSQLQDPFGSQQ